MTVVADPDVRSIVLDGHDKLRTLENYKRFLKRALALP
jgi:hypothetical protein